MNDYNGLYKLCYKLVVIVAWTWHCVFVSDLFGDFCDGRVKSDFAFREKCTWHQ